jgi:hypothetical protein
MYFLHTGTTPPMLFYYDGSNLNAVSPLPDIFVCCNSNDVYVQCNVQMVGAMAVGPELANMVMNVFCAVSEADAIALGLQAHQYWLDVSVTPPVLMHYNGSTSTPATFTPRVVNCCNTGETFIRCMSGASTGDLVPVGGGGGIPAANVNVTACPTGPVNVDTDAQNAICTLSNAISNLAATDVTVSACPSGPVNAATDVQTAICQLSSAAGSAIATQAAVILEVSYPAVLLKNVSSVIYGIPFIRVNFSTPIQVYKSASTGEYYANGYICAVDGGANPAVYSLLTCANGVSYPFVAATGVVSVPYIDIPSSLVPVGVAYVTVYNLA